MLWSKFREIFRFINIHILIIAFINGSCFSCYAGGITVDSGAAGNNVSVDSVGNNVPVVNINDPNSAGVSHNKFTDFNVSNRGVILNNSQERAQSVLGGFVEGNPNLNNNASAIINEVTSTNPSHINGTTEILGRRADYILANPNGIYINGGDFINVHKATLTTGNVYLDSQGGLEKFLVESGIVEIGGKDLNLKNLDYFDIISYGAKINSQIHAGPEVKVIVGKNIYNVKEDTVTPASASGEGGEIAIDSSLLGGLYAGRVKIISTNDGVGVNMPPIESDVGDIEITANGDIRHSHLKSQKNLKLESTKGKIVATDQKIIKVGGGAKYKGGSDIDIGKDTTIKAEGIIELSSGGLIKNQGVLDSNSVKGIKLDSKNLDNSGLIIARNGNITQTNSGQYKNNGKIITAKKLELNFQNKLVNDGKISAKEGVILNGSSDFVNNYSGSVVSGLDLNITASSIDNLGTILSMKEANINSQGKIKNTGKIISRELTKIISGQSITNSGLILSANLVVNSLGGVLDNSGDVLSLKNLDITTALDIKNQGNIINDAGVVKAYQSNNISKYQNNSNLTNSTNNTSNSNNDIIDSNLALLLTSKSGSLNNKGIIYSSGKIKINTANDINNDSGKILGVKELSLVSETGGLQNTNGVIDSRDNLSVKVAGAIDNSGVIESSRVLNLIGGGNLKNNNIIKSRQSLDLVIAGDMDNDMGDIQAISDLKITSEGAVLNKGNILSDGNIVIKNNNGLDNIGIISSNGNEVSINSNNGEILNLGSILGANLAKLKAKGNISNINHGRIESGKDLTITSKEGKLVNRREELVVDTDSIILSGGNLNIKAVSIDNIAGLIESKKDLSLTSDGDLTNTGLIKSDKELDFKIGGKVNNDNGAIEGKSKLQIAVVGEFTNSGNILGESEIIITNDNGLDNSGSISSGNKLSITANNGEIVNIGSIVSSDLAELTAKGNISNINLGRIESGKDLTITSREGKLVNRRDDPVEHVNGFILSRGNLKINSATDIDNIAGHIESRDGIEINNENNLTNSGRIISSDVVRINSKGVLDNTGYIQSSKNLELKQLSRLINAGNISAGKKAEIAAKAQIDNKGVIQVGEDLSVKVTEGGLTNQNIILSHGNINLEARDNVNNQASIKGIGNVDITSSGGNISSSGEVISENGSLKIVAEGDIVQNNAHMQAYEGLNITSNNGSVSNITSVVIGDKDLSIKAKGNVDNQDSIIEAGRTLELISSNGAITNGGNKARITSFGPGRLTAYGDIVNNRAKLEGHGNLEIRSQSGLFHNDKGEVLSARDTSIASQKIVNSGQIQGGNLLDLNSNSNIDNSGILVSAKRGNIAAKTDFENKGITQVETGDITANKIINQGTVNSSSHLNLTSTGNINNKSTGKFNLRSLDMSAGGDINNEGQIHASGKIDIKKVNNFNNSKLIDFGELVINNTTAVKNTPAAYFQGGNLTVTTGAFNNLGVTKLTGKAVIHANSINSNELVADNGGDLNIAGDFVNAKKLHFKSGDLNINARSINNRGELKATAINASSSSTITNAGTVFGAQQVTLRSPSNITNSGRVISDGVTIVESTSGGNIANTGGIYGATTVAIKGNNITNSGRVNSSGSVDIRGSRVSNNQEIAGRNKVDIKGVLTNSGTVITKGDLVVNSGGGTIDNNGNILAHKNATLNSYGLNNRNTIQAAGTLNLKQGAGGIVNNSAIYGGDISLSSGGGITNHRRIVSTRSMSLNASGDFTNMSGAEVSNLGNGNLSIRAANIKNSRNYSVTLFDKDGYQGPSPQDQPTSRKYEYLHRFKDSGIPPTAFFNPDPNEVMSFHGEKELFRDTKLYSFSDSLNSVDPLVPLITSNGNINLNAGTIDNVAGNIAARGNLSVSGGSINNRDIAIKKHNLEHIQSDYFHPWWKKGDFMGMAWNSKRVVQKQQWLEDEVIQTIPSLMQAGGSISGNLSGQLTLGSQESGGGKGVNVGGSSPSISHGNFSVPSGPSDHNIVGKSLGSGQTANLKTLNSDKLAKKTISGLLNVANNVNPLGLNIQEGDMVNPLGINIEGRVALNRSELKTLAENLASSYELPIIQEGGGLSSLPEVSWDFDDPEINAIASSANWSRPETPNKNYTAETSEIYTVIGKYLSTDNFIKRIPGYNPKKEPLHYGDPMMQADLVHRQVLDLKGAMALNEQEDSVKLINKLYASGEKLGRALDLTPGVTLTKDQVAVLQEDIVWPEEMNIGGQRKLVPKVYLGQSKGREQARGFLANNISIQAGSIVNRGSKVVGNNVVMVARDDDIVNKGGLIHGDNVVLSGKSIVNKKGDIVGNNLSATAREGNIVNKDGVIFAKNNLDIYASENIVNKDGGQIESQGSASFRAKNIINLTKTFKHGDDKNYHIEQGKESGIKVANLLALTTRGDVRNAGSSIQAGSLALNVGGSFTSESIELGSGVDESDADGYYRSKSVVYKPATLKVDGDSSGIIAGNFNLLGSKMKVGGNSTLLVGGDSVIQSQVASTASESYLSYEDDGTLGFGSSENEESSSSYREKLVAAGLEVGGRSILANKGDQTFVAAEMSAREGTKLFADKINVKAQSLQDFSSYSATSEDAIWQSVESSGHNVSKVKATSFKNGVDFKQSTSIAVDYDRRESKPSWMRSLEGNSSVKWNPLSSESDYWDKKQSGLTPAASAIVGLAASVATASIGGFGMFGAGGATATTGTLMAQAAITGIAARGTVAMINNGLDPLKAAKDTFSADGIKSLAVDVVTAGLANEISNIAQVGTLKSGMTLADRARVISGRALVGAGVRTGLSGVSGDKIDSIFKREALSGVLATGQSIVGDIADNHGLSNGSISKVAMHSLLGASYSVAAGGNVASGIIGGVASEIIPQIMSSSQGNNSPPVEGALKAASQIVAATGSLLTGGKGRDVRNASSIALSAIEHNRELHGSEQRVLEELQQEAQTNAERQDLEDAAAFLTRIYAGVDPDDNPETYPILLASAERGKTKVKSQRHLITKAHQNREIALELQPRGFISPSQAMSSLDVRTFDYDGVDGVVDAISRNDYYTTRMGQLTQLGSGIVGVGVSSLATSGSIITANPLGTGLGITGLGLSTGYAYDGYSALMSEYQSKTGQRALDSLKGGLSGPTGGQKLVMSAVNTGLDVGAISSAKKATNLVFKQFATVGTEQVQRNPLLPVLEVGPTVKAIKSNVQQSIKAFRSAPEAEYIQLQHEVEQAINNYNRIAHKNGNSVINPSNKVVSKSNPEALVFERTQDGSLKIKHNPLEGTKKETLDVRYKDKQFYQELEHGKSILNPKEQTAKKSSSKVLDFITRATKVLRNIEDDF